MIIVTNEVFTLNGRKILALEQDSEFMQNSVFGAEGTEATPDALCIVDDRRQVHHLAIKDNKQFEYTNDHVNQVEANDLAILQKDWS